MTRTPSALAAACDPGRPGESGAWLELPPARPDPGLARPSPRAEAPARRPRPRRGPRRPPGLRHHYAREPRLVTWSPSWRASRVFPGLGPLPFALPPVSGRWARPPLAGLLYRRGCPGPSNYCRRPRPRCPHSSAVRGADRHRELRSRGGRSSWRAFYRRLSDVFVVAAAEARMEEAEGR
jgi:hypothetical protein